MFTSAHLLSRLASGEPINIATIGEEGITAPVVRTLNGQLRALYSKLLDLLSGEKIVLEVAISYSYPINNGVLHVGVPVLLATPFEISRMSSAQINSLDEVSNRQAEACKIYLKNHAPILDEGRLMICVRVISALTGDARPQLEFDGLFLPLSDVLDLN